MSRHFEVDRPPLVLDLVLAARRGDKLDALADQVWATEQRAVTDVTDPEECEATVRAGLEAFGRIVTPQRPLLPPVQCQGSQLHDVVRGWLMSG
ncbi:hypothetical protein AB0E10_44710 [Streptomyces sp. NPDC048045]|uniref:hypothetical protein n=1 Tax=Streptomyces sp. NPDC048045 TaxID=3154710 RepID=UPI0034364CC6